MSCHVAKLELQRLRSLQESSLLCSFGFGGHSAVNTLLDEPARDDELGKMKRHHSEPALPSSSASTEFGEERQLPSFLSSEACEGHKLPSSFLSDTTLPLSFPSDNKLSSTLFSFDHTEGTNIVYEDDKVETHGVSQLQITTCSADAVGNDDDLVSMCTISGSGAARSSELPELEMRSLSCMANGTSKSGIARRESECTSEFKSISDSIPGDHHISNKGTLERESTWDEWDDNVTTVMIRQLPLHCTQAMLMAEITNRGLGNAFDFLFIPWDMKKFENVGYGFINFLQPMYAVACRDAFDGTYLPRLSPRKPLNVHPAHLQGYEANYKHFVSTKVGKKQLPSRFNPIFLPFDSASGPKKIMSSKSTNPKHSKTSKFQKLQIPQQNQKPQQPWVYGLWATGTWPHGLWGPGLWAHYPCDMFANHA